MVMIRIWVWYAYGYDVRMGLLFRISNQHIVGVHYSPRLCANHFIMPDQSCSSLPSAGSCYPSRGPFMLPTVEAHSLLRPVIACRRRFETHSNSLLDPSRPCFDKRKAIRLTKINTRIDVVSWCTFFFWKRGLYHHGLSCLMTYKCVSHVLLLLCFWSCPAVRIPAYACSFTKVCLQLNLNKPPMNMEFRPSWKRIPHRGSDVILAARANILLFRGVSAWVTYWLCL